MKTFAERVRYLRKELGLNQTDFGKRVGLSQTTISDIERERNTGSREVVHIATALQVNPTWLADGRGPIRFTVQEPPAAYSVTAPALDPRHQAVLDLFDGLTQSQQNEFVKTLKAKKHENDQLIAELLKRSA